MDLQRHEHWRAYLLRTKETADEYERVKEQHEPTTGCRICNDPETYDTFEHWRLVPNRFPYDRYFSKSDMLITKRHIDETGLTEEERREFIKLKKTILNDRYDIVLENLPKQSSIPHHYHVHLAVLKQPETI